MGSLRRLFALGIGALMLSATSAGAQDAPPAASVNEITRVDLHHADSMEISQREGQPQVLQGNVDMTLVDRRENQTRVQAQKITVFYDADSGAADRIVAEGGVVITRADLVANTELMVYDSRQETVDLLEDNLVRDKRGELIADRIRLHLRTDQVSAEGNVRGIVYPNRTAAEDDGGNS